MFVFSFPFRSHLSLSPTLGMNKSKILNSLNSTLLKAPPSKTLRRKLEISCDDKPMRQIFRISLPEPESRIYRGGAFRSRKP
ncbi:hypothetical protein RchiOBHm_Chr6g0246021 [Rosa chinensis]|uniref:Uncharacterized protein n=1 Tax=Rosa chinensis TaxID=74649 RepID=A0A2P6PJE5_ROSCH|nr:hypothetical protein RchiOBHm_Chr6g0246021 [Rosa chinensis]